MCDFHINKSDEMILEYINLNNSREIISINKKAKTVDRWIKINAKNKLEFIKEFLPLFMSGQKLILFDSNHKQLLDFHEQNNINKFKNIDEVNKHSQLLFFTSGSSSFPIGAFKSRENLEKEIKVLKKLVKKYDIKKVVVSVPFVHIYGVLAGLLLPLHLGEIKLVIKENFLPYELLYETLDRGTLVITTPVYIKALPMLREDINLSKSLFICSTGPLDKDDVVALEDKYKTNLLQLFGSTETGGIAYKFSSSTKWIPMDSVEVSTSDDRLCVKSEFVSPFIIDEKIIELYQPFVTEDIIEKSEKGFTLVGRSNKIIKIAGKRISASHIESQLEGIDGVEKVVVELVYKKELLRSEQINIILQANNKISKKIIKDKICESYGVLTIPFKIIYVQSIDFSSMGKKIIFR